MRVILRSRRTSGAGDLRTSGQPSGNWARARVLRFRRGERDADLAALLNKLVERETRPEWLAWERRELLRLSSQPTTEPAGDTSAGG